MRKKYCYLLLQSGQATTSHHFRCLQQLQTNAALFCICYHSSQTTAERKIKRIDGSVQQRGFLNKKATTNIQLRRNTIQVVFYIHTKYKCRGWRTKDKIYSRYEFVLYGYSGHQRCACLPQSLCYSFEQYVVASNNLGISNGTEFLYLSSRIGPQKPRIISTITNTAVLHHLTIFHISHSGPVT